MKVVILLVTILLGTLSTAQAQLSRNDPCYKDNESIKCLEKVRTSIFFTTGVDGTYRSEYGNFLDSYFNKYGIEGFYKPASQYRSGSMLEYAITSSRLTSLNKKLILAVPKGQSVEGLNIYALVIRKSPPFTRYHDMNSYVESLKILFPEKGNEDFKITNELFGLPWDDPDFAEEYLNRMKAVVKSIDQHNSFFKKTEFLNVKKEMENLIAHVTELDQLPNKVCQLDKYDDFTDMINKYGDILKSRNTDIIGCLIKNQKYDLVGKIIENNVYDQTRLPAYFDQTAAIKESPESFKLGQALYLRMAQNGQKINPVKGEKQRDFLQRSSVYLNRYDQEDIICELQPHNGTTIGDLSKDLGKILFIEAYQLMEKILATEDDIKKEALIEQFSHLKEVGFNMAQLHPTNGKTIMHLIAEAGDVNVVNSLNKKKVYPNIIGENVENKSGKKPIDVAIDMGSKKTLILAQNLFKNAYYSNYEDLKELKKQVRKLKSNDEEAKAQKKIFIDDISSAMLRTY